MSKTLVLVRGLPGSGKSLFATSTAQTVVSADDFFVWDGKYTFEPAKLPEAHAWCQRTVRESLITQPHRKVVAVANTFSQRWELEPYLKMAEEIGCTVHVVDLYDGGLGTHELMARNTHGVPLEGIQRMQDRWEHCWRVGETTPPWERA